ncbi:Flagellar hook-associated protein 2 [Shewanella piezotolerans WP3]|uniref:Flagellar hook-associated protein 2 n=1 Tax=Shewanella piezotolerans (strain WP3 / JCM 13877) TaxID=225849 RepID=B8CVQ8_SHEPW|nr:flagellar filament capping protein FliD [Shewanella piezotolerans]ACJ31734.1 Flagellar hook-associated protein 2 [Shewanella piezotolerans WP3]
MISGMSAATFAEQLISAERMGKDQLYKTSMTKHQSQLDAYEILESSLKKMTSKLEAINGDAFESKTSSISDENASITVESDAPAGSYDLYVKQLAQSHQLSKSFSSETEVLPTTGVLSIQVGPNAADTIDIDMAVLNADGTRTVSDLRDAINNHSDNPGVQASLVRTGGQVELMMTSKESGAAKNIDVKMDGVDWGMTERKAAQDAEVTLNGIDITSSSNYLGNVIDGVSIELNRAHAVGESSSIKIESDSSTSEQAVKDFVESFNDLMDQINQLTRSMGSSVVDEANKDKDKDDDEEDEDAPSSITEDQLGVLKGDSSLRMLQNSMRNSVFDAAPNGMRLSDVGIEMNRDGKLNIDEDKLNQALKDDPAAIKEMFTASGSFVDRIDTIIDPFTKSSGYLDLKQNNLDKQIERVEDSMSRHDYQMQQRYQIYLSQFTAMENTINQLNSASALFY